MIIPLGTDQNQPVPIGTCGAQQSTGKTVVQTGHRTGLNQNWSRPVGNQSGLVIHHENIIYTLLNIIYTLLNNKYTN